MLGKAIGPRRELTPSLLYPACINLLPYDGDVYTFSFAPGCTWLKYFYVSLIEVRQVLKLSHGCHEFTGNNDTLCMTLTLFMDAFLDPSPKAGSSVSHSSVTIPIHFARS